MNTSTLVLIILTLSCSSKPRDPQSLTWTSEDLKTVDRSKILSKKDIEEDLQFLEYALTKAYSVYFFQNKDSVDSSLEKLKSNKMEPQSAQSLCHHIANAFSSVRDNHLTFGLEYYGCSDKSATPRVGKRYKHKENKIWVVETIKHQNKSVLIISISSFPSQSSPEWSGFLAQVEVQLLKTDTVVIDLRGNGGGDDAIGFKLAQLLTKNGKVSIPYSDQYKVTTKEGLVTNRNYFSLAQHFSKSKSEKAFLKNYAKKNFDKYYESDQEFVAVSLNSKKPQISKARHPIYIVQDKACGSSCESTIDFFEFISPVVKVGENTAGSLHFKNLGFALLPNSKIRVNIPSTYNTYFDNRFIEAVGIEPDIRVKSGEDALEAALAEVSKSD